MNKIDKYQQKKFVIRVWVSDNYVSSSDNYFSFDIGKDDKKHLKNTYDTSFVIYLIISLFIVLICETGGLWFLNNRLVIPTERLDAACVVLHLSLNNTK